MGRVAVDFGVGQGAKRSADIQCDLGQASNEGKRQNQRNRRRREAEGQLAASLGRYSPKAFKAGSPRSATRRTTRAGPLSNRALRVAWKAGRLRAPKVFRTLCPHCPDRT